MGLEETICEHIERAKHANTHPAKLLVLSDLLKKLFNVTIDELIPGIEASLGSKILGIKGKADLLFGDVVLEIKVDFDKELEDAKDKLQNKYLKVLFERDPQRKHIGIATDGIKFVAYLPTVKEKDITGLHEVGSLDISQSSPAGCILWLDSFLFFKVDIKPTAEDLRWRFGSGSPTYAISILELEVLWSKVKEEEDIKLRLSLWEKYMQMVYGSAPEIKAFLNHTYLVTLVKLIIYLRLSGSKFVRDDEITKAIAGEYFISYGISNLIEEDFFSWIMHSEIKKDAVALAVRLAKELLRYDMSQIDEDLFKEIYQDIVERGARHRIGEYYTPEWLAELTLTEASKFVGKKHRDLRILDPACGSGTFITNSVHSLERQLKGKLDDKEILEVILSNVVGVDINPLAVVITKANYIIALKDLLLARQKITLPIFVADNKNFLSKQFRAWK